ncbi:chorismate-binding protein, partial [Micromonospora sp. DH15]|nr:chorismate-binding protein [Micromonospora sp. DH15]
YLLRFDGFDVVGSSPEAHLKVNAGPDGRRRALLHPIAGTRPRGATPDADARLAAELLADGTVEAVTVVAPTEHLKTQWAQAAARVGIQLDAAFRNADLHSSADFHGAVVTYAQVGMAPQVHRRRTMTRRTLVILDEIHHAGDSRTWGDGVKAAFEPAVRRLMLTGTPFRSDDNPIP